MALTLAQQSNLRRHLDMPVGGRALISTASGTLANGNAGYRYLDQWGQLEWRMNNLNADEEARLLGQPCGLVSLTGSPVTAGIVFQLQFSGGGLVSPVTISYTSSSSDNQLSVCSAISNAVNQNATLIAAGFVAFNQYTFQPLVAVIPLPQMGFENITLGVTSFTLTVLSNTNPQLVVNLQGQLLAPSAPVSDLTNPTTVIWGYLPIADWLEGAVPGATRNLDTSKADTWFTRIDEVDAREDLYERWKQRMGDFLFGKGAWTGPSGKPGGSYQLKGSII